MTALTLTQIYQLPVLKNFKFLTPYIFSKWHYLNTVSGNSSVNFRFKTDIYIIATLPLSGFGKDRNIETNELGNVMLVSTTICKRIIFRIKLIFTQFDRGKRGKKKAKQENLYFL